MDFMIVLMYGLIIGSFLNVVIYRVPLKKSIVSPGSKCGSCNTSLRPIDLIPIVSFLALRGKCRYCGAKVSWRYPGVELFTGLVFSGVYFVYGFSLTTLIYVVFMSLLISIAFIDYDHMIIPNSLNKLIGVLSVVQLGLGLVSFRFVIWGIVVGGGVLLSIILIGALFKVQAMGMGDLKLMLVSGALLGPVMIMIAYFIAFSVGGLFTLGIVLFKRLSLKDKIPFGPFLTLGLGLALLLYPYILGRIM